MTTRRIPFAMAVGLAAVGLAVGVMAALGGASAAGGIAESGSADGASALVTDTTQPQVDNLSDEQRDAIVDGVRAGADLAGERGVNLTEADVEAAFESAEDAAAGYPNASVDELRETAAGASHGALLQRRQANLTGIQAAIEGATAGALNQSDAANESQIRNAAYGGAHGAVAHHQRANASQLRAVARGGAGGAAQQAGRAGIANVSQIQEAAQGGAYGALEPESETAAAGLEAAAFGAAGGLRGAGEADPKQVQSATMGAARGAVAGGAGASTDQIRAAARGGAAGALTNHRNATVVQLQLVSAGAARGASSAADVASAEQIEAAASGAARGTIVQTQRIDVVQVQYAASGAATGAARTAGERDVQDRAKIEAAAAGAGWGSIVQIQQVNVVQIQIVAEGAASGALSQHQQATVVQIQSAARGASEGTLTLSQRQQVTVEQSQQRSERVAATSAGTAARIEIRNEITVYTYAKGIAGDDDGDGADGEPDGLRSLFFSAEDGTVFLANPTDGSVTVTVTSEAGDVRTVTLAAGESTTVGLESGTYAITAETAEGETVELAGREEISLTVGQDPQSLDASVEDGELVVENPNDDGAVVTVRRDGTRVLTFWAPATDERRWELAPGTYTVTATTEDGRSVPVNGQSEASLTVEAGSVSLGLTVDGQNVTLDNPGDVDVTVTATDDAGEDSEIDVPAGETVTETFDPGNYTLEGEATDGRQVSIDGQPTAEVSIEGEEPLNLDVATADGNVTVTNPGELNATVTAAGPDDREFDVPAGEATTATLAPGNYTLTATADGRTVTLNGQSELDVDVAEAPVEPVDLDVTVQDGNVTLANPNDTAVTVTAAAEDADNRTVTVPGESSVRETFGPGNYTLTATAEADRPVTLDGQDEFSFSVAETPASPIDLDVTVQDGNVTLANPNGTEVTVTAATEDGDERTVTVPGNSTVTETFEPGNYTLTATAEADRAVTLDGQDEFSFSVAEAPPEAIDLTVTVVDGNLTVENPADVGVTVDAASSTAGNTTIDVPAGENVTESLDPGNYTLRGTAPDERPVTIEGEEEYALSVSAPGVANEITDCGVIDQAGRYTVASDLQAPADGTRLHVRASDVIVEGDEHLVEGTGTPGDPLPSDEEFGGVLVSRSDEQIIGNVSVRNVTFRDWRVGVVVGNGTDHDAAPENVTVANASFRSNEYGARFWGGSGTVRDSVVVNSTAGIEASVGGHVDLRNLTVQENELGVSGADSQGIDIRASTIRNNAQSGISLNQLYSNPLTVTNATVADNGGWGVELNGAEGLTMQNVSVTDNGAGGVLGRDTEDALLENVTLRANDGDGYANPGSSGSATILNATVEDNDGAGVSVPQSSVSIEDSTVRDNGGLAVDARTGNASATDLQVGNETLVDFTDEPIGLDHVDQSALPPLPENATAVGSGLDVGGDVDSLDVSFVVVPEAGGLLEVWRHDGTDWSVAADSTETTVPDGRIAATLDENGTYAPVEVTEPDEPSDLNATVENDAVALENPTNSSLTATVSNASGNVTTTAVAAGADESVTGLAPGEYTLTAESQAGGSATVNGEPDLQFTLPPDLESLTLSTDGDLAVENPNDVAVEVALANESGVAGTVSVDAEGSAAFEANQLAAGTYTASATTDDDRRVPVDGAWNATVSVEAGEEPVTESPTPTPTESPTPTPTETATTVPSPTETPTATESPTATTESQMSGLSGNETATP